MSENTAVPLRHVKTLSERAAELETVEKLLTGQLQSLMRELEDIAIQRCAIAFEQRRGFGSSAQKKKTAPIDWETLLKKENSEMRSVRKARRKALTEMQLVRGWTTWKKYPQVLIAFELVKSNPAFLFGVRESIQELLPHLAQRIPGYRILGVCVNGPYSIHHFLLCSVNGDHFQVMESYLNGPDKMLFESLSLHPALDYIQKNLAR